MKKILILILILFISGCSFLEDYNVTIGGSPVNDEQNRDPNSDELIDQLNEVLDLYEELINENENIKGQISNLEDEVDNLELDKSQLQLELDNLLNDYQNLVIERDKLLNDISSLQLKYDNLIKEIENEDFTSEIERLLLELADLQALNDELSNQNNELQADNDELQLENNQLNNQVAELLVIQSNLELEKTNLENIINDLNTQKDLLSQEISSLEAEINNLLILNEDLFNENEELNVLLEDYNTLSDINKSLEQEISVLELQINNYIDEINNFNDYINQISLDAMHANVKIITRSYRTGFGGRVYSSNSSLGSGVIFRDDGTSYYVLTNNHVIYGDPDFPNREYFVYDHFGNEYQGSFVDRSADYDLGVIKFTKSDDLNVLGFAIINPLVDDWVIALGQPKGQINTLTVGTLHRYTTISISVDEELVNVNFPVIQHDAPVNSGSSGGVLINSNLEIIGINYAAAKDSSGNVIAGYAIPIEKVIEFLELNNIVY